MASDSAPRRTRLPTADIVVTNLGTLAHVTLAGAVFLMAGVLVMTTDAAPISSAGIRPGSIGRSTPRPSVAR